MKTTDTRTAAAQPAKKTGPFFKKGAEQGFFKPAAPGVQTKLTVGEPGDVYEKEADAMADQVVRRMPTEGLGEEVKRKELGLAKKIRRKPIFESKNDPKDVQRKCAACEKEEAGAVQKKGEAGGASASTEAGIASTKGSGSALPSATQSQMESAFGADFSGVKIHANAHAAEMNKDLNAQAFTHGKDVYFDSGKFKPQSVDGQHLLAHELTHVVQQTGSGDKKKVSGSEKKVQRAGGKARGKCKLTPGKAKIDDVTNNCPFAGGTISRKGGSTSIVLNDLPVKANVDKDFLAKINKTLPITLPAPGDRAETPTKQVKMWKEMVKEGVESKVEDHLKKINSQQSIENKKKPKNFYNLRLPKSTGFVTIVGNYRNLVEDCLIPKWDIRGKARAFEVEHIMDFQIAGAAADHPANLMLLSGDRNKELGQDFLRLIRQKISDVLDHYNQYVPAGTLVETGFRAQKQATKDYRIQAASLKRVQNPFTKEEAILEDYLLKDPKSQFDPLKKGNIEINSFGEAKKGQFLLQSAAKNSMIVLPWNNDHLHLGSYVLSTRGNENDGLTSVTATIILNSDAARDKKNPGDKNYKFAPAGNLTKAFLVQGFGLEMSQLRINYLSTVNFKLPMEIDSDFNLQGSGVINKPTPRFLQDTISVNLNGQELSLEKTFSADKLGAVGPMKVDEADLLFTLSTAEGFRVSGGVEFSIPKVGRGRVKASTGKNGFVFAGGFDFDKNIVESGNITISYDSTRDVDGQNPWKMSGSMVLGNKIKGIDHAEIKVGYDGNGLTFDGNAKLNVPGVKSATLSGSYHSGQDFSLALGAMFDFKNKYIQDPQIELKLVIGGGAGAGTAGADDNSNWKLSMTGKLTLRIPKMGDVLIDVSYDQGLFDASGKATEIKVGDHVSGNLTVGITNKPVDAATGAVVGGATAGGKDLRLYGGGQITVSFNQHLTSTVGVRLTEDGKVLLNGNVTLKDQPLMPGDKLYGDDFKIFDMHSPQVPVFSIGVGDVFIQVGGHANANYWIGVPSISVDANLKDADIHDPAGMKVNTTITPQIKASAGIGLTAFFTFGARVAVLEAKGTVSGTIGLKAESTFHPSIALSWSPTEGLSFVGASIDLDADIKADLDLKGKVEVLLNFYFTTVGIWDKSWDLGHFDLGDLGKISLNFPLNFGKDGAPAPPGQLKPKTPFADKDAATGWVVNKPGGAGKKEQGKSEEEIQREVQEDIRRLPAVGPRNPKYQQIRGRDFYYKELKQVMPIDLEFYRKIWYDVEAEEFEELRARILQPVDEPVSKSAQIDAFEMDHVMVEPAKITALRADVVRMEAAAQSSQAPEEPPTEPNSSPLLNPPGKI
jgi:hypothetical protein